MEKGWLRIMVRYPLVALVEKGRLTQGEAAQEMGLSVRQVRRVLQRYRQSGGKRESPILRTAICKTLSREPAARSVAMATHPGSCSCATRSDSSRSLNA
ncbi:MAG: helix-turn-helix domain-containing protein [Dehalococcoidia bacterium]